MDIFLIEMPKSSPSPNISHRVTSYDQTTPMLKCFYTPLRCRIDLCFILREYITVWVINCFFHGSSGTLSTKNK